MMLRALSWETDMPPCVALPLSSLLAVHLACYQAGYNQ